MRNRTINHFGLVSFHKKIYKLIICKLFWCVHKILMILSAELFRAEEEEGFEIEAILITIQWRILKCEREENNNNTNKRKAYNFY